MTTGALVNGAENSTLDWLTGNTTTAKSGSLKVRLMTANGSDSATGTEVVGGSYAAQTVTFGAASGGSTSNSADLTFAGMPACTVVGLEIWDSAGSPVRWWWGALTSSVALLVGETLTIAAGSLTLALD
jgi:hypothetical protein